MIKIIKSLKFRNWSLVWSIDQFLNFIYFNGLVTVVAKAEG